jgi:hypothetical protein
MADDRNSHRRKIRAEPAAPGKRRLPDREYPLEGFSPENREKGNTWRRDMSPPGRFKKIQKRRDDPIFDEPGGSQIKRGRLTGEEKENLDGKGA